VENFRSKLQNELRKNRKNKNINVVAALKQRSTNIWQSSVGFPIKFTWKLCISGRFPTPVRIFVRFVKHAYFDSCVIVIF